MISPRLREENHGVYVALRTKGRRVATGWRDDGRVGEALEALVADIASKSDGAGAADTAEVCLEHSLRQIDADRRAATANIYRGVRGIEIDGPSGTFRRSPTTMLASNRNFEKVLRRFATEQDVALSDIRDEQLRTFECDEVLVFIDRGEAVRMERGNQLVKMSDVTHASTEAFTNGMADWLLSNLHMDGRMTYKWWPSRGDEAPSNNMIRQWMASVALVRMARERNDAALFERAAKNIDYNLAHFYRQDSSGRGFIYFRNKAKLGAAALAAMAILLHPDRQRWSRYEAALLKTIYYLQEKNGHFVSFLLPQGYRNYENFYPGEALLYLATRYAMDKEPDIPEHIMRSFRYYRRWHREHRNPAFIPWHTQAYYTMWKETHDEELRDFVFEINDWLLGMQQWDSAPFPDLRGRFFDPRRPQMGPPHASATGVYLEGLADAFALAREVDDKKRVDAYRRAIVRGIRSSMQLQFADDVDMYYVSERNQVRGGLRTTVYDNVIRVDNVQHTFMGVQKILHELSDQDFALGAR